MDDLHVNLTNNGDIRMLLKRNYRARIKCFGENALKRCFGALQAHATLIRREMQLSDYIFVRKWIVKPQKQVAIARKVSEKSI